MLRLGTTMPETGHAYASSRATEPYFYRAPVPGNTPHPAKEYQLAGAEYVLARNHALIGDAPGLGKTAQCIFVGNAIEAQRTLVVCLGADTLVLTDSGWKQIVDVSTDDQLWDGVEWVQHQGLVYQGQKETINLAGVSVTPDHILLSGPEWYPAAQVAQSESILSRALATASENLPSQAWGLAQREDWVKSTQNSRPVYDLVNAGPRQRFTILTDRGPLLAHNCPASLRLNWEREIWMWSTLRNVSTYPVSKTKDGISPDHDYVIISYDLLRNPAILGAIMSLYWDHLILDEAHYLKDPKGNQRTKAICAPDLLPSVCGRITMASGTILPNQPIECLGADTLVLTDSGWKQIIDVTTDDQLWDGVEWVQHQGLVYRGEKKTIDLAGVSMTPDHEVLTGDTWSLARDLDSRGSILNQALATGSENLPWQAMCGGLVAGLRQFRSCATADLGRTKCGTAEQSKNCKPASMNLKPVYDLVNAGPRRRFTILTDRGPLVTHNCYNAIRLLNWGAIGEASLEEFRNFYYDKGGGMTRGPRFDEKRQLWVTDLHWSQDVRNVPRRLEDLQQRLRENVMIRRTRQQVLAQLPEMQWHPFPLATTSQMRKALKHPGWEKAEKLFELAQAAGPGFKEAVAVDGEVNTARRLLGEAKAKPCADYVNDLLNSGVQKVVVCAWHLSVLQILRDKLSYHGLVYMDGSTSQIQRQLAVDRFQNEDTIRVILGQMKPLGEGWTLTKAQDVVICEPRGTPGTMEQMVLRILRLGQEGDYILAHVPVVPDTLDERTVSTVIQRDSTIYEALDA